jgi:ABC-type phosphate transport system permease subunit
MIRAAAVLPFGRGGIIGGTMLGLGRALGETIAVYMRIISPIFNINFRILSSGTNSVSSLIALRYGESSPFGLSAAHGSWLGAVSLLRWQSTSPRHRSLLVQGQVLKHNGLT